MSSHSILVVGATGKQGGQAISTLLAADQPQFNLQFLTRNPTSKAAVSLVSKGAKAFRGDLFDKEALAAALVRVDRAFLVTDAGVGEERETLQGVNFIDAAKEAGVEHLVFTSVCAADIARDVPHFRSKAKIEEHLKTSGMTYTILRPVAFMDNFPAAPGFSRYMVIGLFYAAAGWKKCQLVATEDIGVFAGKALLLPDSPDFKNTVIDLSGGEYDLEDLRQEIRKAQGYVPWLASYVPTAVRNLLPHDFKQMMLFFDGHGFPETDISHLRSIHPGLMTAEDYFRKYQSPA